jgi:hypothetical protein
LASFGSSGRSPSSDGKCPSDALRSSQNRAIC